MRDMGGNGEAGRQGEREGWFKVDGDVKVDRLIARSGDSLVRGCGEEAPLGEVAGWVQGQRKA